MQSYIIYMNQNSDYKKNLGFMHVTISYELELFLDQFSDLCIYQHINYIF